MGSLILNQHQPLDASALLAELEQKDRLIEQLSEELMRYVRQPDTVATTGDRLLESPAARDMSETDAATADLQQLADRNRELEELLQELPDIYQEKFAARLDPVKAELERLRAENQRLRAEIKSLNYRLSVRSSTAADAVNLPNFATYDAGSASSIGHV